MLIVGEKINTGRPGIESAILKRDVAFIQNVALRQKMCGAGYLDINCTTMRHKEPEALAWVVETVQTAVDIPICIDTPNIDALAAGLAVHKGRAMINAISGETDRYQSLISLIKNHHCRVIALCIDDRGVPESIGQEAEVAGNIIHRLQSDGVALEDIFIDPLVRPVSDGEKWGTFVMHVIQEIKKVNPNVNFMCGLSNISFGLPMRSLLNRVFLVLAMGAGLNGAILDPENKPLMAALRAAMVLTDQDEGFREYLVAFREGRLSI